MKLLELRNVEGGVVTLVYPDHDICRDHPFVLGKSWTLATNGKAYALVDNRPDLPEALRAEGFRVYAGEWSPP